MYTIYLHTNKTTSKSYVGLTKYTMKQRWKQHVYHSQIGSELFFHRAIRKYGEQDWDHLVLELMTTFSGANRAEEIWIDELNTFINGYNLTRGGMGCSMSEQIKMKISKKVHERLAKGTHQFQGLQGSQLACRVQRHRVKMGTHHFQGGKIQRKTHKKRIENGTHHFLGKSNPIHKRTENGENPFQGKKGSQLAHKVNKRRWARWRCDNNKRVLNNPEVGRRIARMWSGKSSWTGDDLKLDRYAAKSYSRLVKKYGKEASKKFLGFLNRKWKQNVELDVDMFVMDLLRQNESVGN